MENVEVKQEIKNSDDGKGILITNDAIEQIANLLKGQSDKKALRVGVRSGGCSGDELYNGFHRDKGNKSRW